MPQIAPDEVLIESHTSGICGTDLHILAGHGYVPALPHILGHEPAGVVAEVGRDVTNVRPGDRVVPHLFFSCNRCLYCRTGRSQQCSNLRGILGVLGPGAFAEYFKVPAENLFLLPDAVPFDAGGLIADAVLTGLHAVRRAALKAGRYGGGVGRGRSWARSLFSSWTPPAYAAAAIDRTADKLRLASEMGAVAAFDADTETARAGVMEFSDGAGVECVFNCVGTPDSMRLGGRPW